VLLLLAGFIWSARSLFKQPPRNKIKHQRRHQLTAFLVVLPLIDLALAGYLLFVQLPQSITTLPLTLYFEPDIGLMYLLILVFTLGWGTLRTVLAIRKLFGTGRVPAPTA
jgi:hypothetical protein